MVICLERGVDLYMAQLMPLPLTVSCFTKIQIGFTFLVPAHLGSPGQRALKRVCVCVFVFVKFLMKLTSLCGIIAIYIGGRFSRTWCMCSSLCEIASLDRHLSTDIISQWKLALVVNSSLLDDLTVWQLDRFA